MPVNSNKQSGFTLLELLVAISIFAVMSVMIFGGLSEVINVRTDTDRYTARLTELQLAFMHFSRDVRQAVNRPVRGEYGDELNALQSNDIGKYRFELTRVGYPNPARLNRSDLQRVAYGVEDNKLYRYQWKVIDRAEDSKPFKIMLLDNIRAMNLRFLKANNNDTVSQGDGWVTAWPPGTDDDNKAELPDVVEVTFELEDWGRFTRLFVLPEV